MTHHYWGRLGGLGCLFGVYLILQGTPAFAQSSDRDRAQMLQMQQQLQRLQSDNAALQKELARLQALADGVEKAKKEAAGASKDLARLRATSAAEERQLELARTELGNAREQAAKQVEEWRKALEERDNALQILGVEKRRCESGAELVAARLKLQTARADLCETKHAQAMGFGNGVINLYEADRLRLCEPITGLWKVRKEEEIQKLRDQLHEMRLDVPLEAPPGAMENDKVAQPRQP